MHIGSDYKQIGQPQTKDQKANKWQKAQHPQSSDAAAATHHQTPVARAHSLHKTSKKPDG
jgi:hypothetical protein